MDSVKQYFRKCIKDIEIGRLHDETAGVAVSGFDPGGRVRRWLLPNKQVIVIVIVLFGTEKAIKVNTVHCTEQDTKG